MHCDSIKIDLDQRGRAHHIVMSHCSLIRRLNIRLLVRLFKIFFYKRWRLSIQHIEDSSLDLKGKDAERLAQYALEHLGLTVMSTLSRAFISHKSMLKIQGDTLQERLKSLESLGIHIEGKNHLERVIDSQRGVIFVSAHLGAWEELITLGSWLGRPIQVISKRMKNKVAQYFWERSRHYGPKRLDRGKRALIIKRILLEGGTIADVLDQHDPRPNALELMFLGRNAQTSGDLARFARATNAVILPIALLRDIRIDRDSISSRLKEHSSTQLPFTLCISAPIDPQDYLDLTKTEFVEKITQRCLIELEQLIMRAPEQWLWLHRRWKPRFTKKHGCHELS